MKGGDPMLPLMNPDRIRIARVLKDAGVSLPYSEIASRAKLVPEVTLAHLDVLEAGGIVKSHWGKPSTTKSNRLERCFELTGKLPEELDKIDKLVQPLRA
jgi:DNA-binding transcriptional ArsR family regulator